METTKPTEEQQKEQQDNQAKPAEGGEKKLYLDEATGEMVSKK